MVIEKEKKKSSPSNTAFSALIAGLPLMFIAGLFVGYQVWGKPNVQADLAADPQVADSPSGAAPRYDIPIQEDDPVLGSEDAPVTIIEFSDYECPYCQRYHAQTYGQIMATYGDRIRYVFKDLPLTSIHPAAVPAANAAHCAQEQNAFWDFHNLLFSMQLGLNDEAYMSYAGQLNLDLGSFEECLDDGRYVNTVLQDTQILTSINAPLSTPTFFINGQYLAGAQPFSEFARVIEAELTNAN